jgi:3-deoxy-D-arabino-heptulosonate 7-phosphate (DAHP) synthase
MGGRRAFGAGVYDLREIVFISSARRMEQSADRLGLRLELVTETVFSRPRTLVGVPTES